MVDGQPGQVGRLAVKHVEAAFKGELVLVQTLLHWMAEETVKDETWMNGAVTSKDAQCVRAIGVMFKMFVYTFDQRSPRCRFFIPSTNQPIMYSIYCYWDFPTIDSSTQWPQHFVLRWQLWRGSTGYLIALRLSCWNTKPLPKGILGKLKLQ